MSIWCICNHCWIIFRRIFCKWTRTSIQLQVALMQVFYNQQE